MYSSSNISPSNDPKKDPISLQNQDSFTPSQLESMAGSVIQPKGSSTYIDMGKLYGTYVISNMIRWWPEPVCIDQQKLDSFLDSFFNQLGASHTNDLELSFAQIQDIQNLLEGKAGSPSDTITSIFSPTGHDGPYPIGDTGQDFLTYFVNKAHDHGVGVDLSFGGAIVGKDDMVIPGNDGAKAALDLIAFLDKYGIDSVDFDIEGSGGTYLIQKNSPQVLDAFFTTLHTEMKKRGDPVIITLEGSIQAGPDTTLSPLFENYSSKFDGINLMLYSQTQYYIDAKNDAWGIVEWIQTLTEKSGGTASTEEIMEGIHIGFYDAIDYTNPNSSAGQHYNIPSGLSNGQAAAFVYQQLEQALQKAFPKEEIQLGDPFLWTDNPSKIPDSTFMKDFFSYLKT